MHKKQILRKTILEKRTSFVDAGSSEKIVESLKSYFKHSKTKTVLCYFPMHAEVDLIPLYHLLLEQKYSLFFPKIHGENEMDFFQLFTLDEFKKNSQYNFFEPIDTSIKYKEQNRDTILVPSLALDKRGYRVGFGKGFYDKFLARMRNLKTIAPQFEEFIFDTIPIDSWDQKISLIVSEAQLYFVGL